MSVSVFGAKGQLGRALRSIAPPDLKVTYAGRLECDLTDANAVNSYIDKINPEYIINCAAYTAGDKAEKEVETCYAVNRDAVQHIADCCPNRKLIHISTDFVFDGKKQTPYEPEDTTGPLGVYGKSKLAGEQAVLQTISDQAMIIRAAWVYYTSGANFVKTMLRLMTDREALSAVNDQRGSPTFARSLADAIWRVITQRSFTPGTYRWTDSGNLTWYEFAQAIQEGGRAKALLKKAIAITPIPALEYPTPACRPGYNVLDTTKLANLIKRAPSPWRDNLDVMLTELSTQ